MGERIALAEPYARARREDDNYYGQFVHVLKRQSPHVSDEMCGPPSMVDCLRRGCVLSDTRRSKRALAVSGPHARCDLPPTRTAVAAAA